MKKILLSLGVLGAAFATGCGSSSSGSSSGGSIETCSTDADCMGDICNTNGHVCMHQCSAVGDCSSTENASCAAVPSNTGTGNATDQTVCQCSASTCGGGSTCNSVDLICETTCSSDSDCSGYSTARTCQGGMCLPMVTAVDGGCATNPAICPTGDTCNTATNTCEPGSCGSANTLGMCTTADTYCDGTSCQPATACAALTSSAPAMVSNSPIIWGVAPTGSTRTDSMCNGNIVQIQGYYLNEGSGTVTTGMNTSATYKAVSWITPAGGYGGGMSANSYDNTVNITDTTFSFELCNPSASVQPAVVLMDSSGDVSNAACITY